MNYNDKENYITVYHNKSINCIHCNQLEQNSSCFTYSTETNQNLPIPDNCSYSIQENKRKGKLELFCVLSSIRGVQRIYSSEIPFIRLLWIIFVITMTCVLMVSSGFLISDYLRYSTAWNTRSLLDDKSEFPAITLCAHNPFSLAVNRLWKENIVPSPREIKSRLRQLLMTMLDNGITDYTGDLAFSDSIEFYYTNLNSEDTIKVGHDKDMLYHCMLYEEGSTVVAEKCDLEPETSIRIRRFTHPKYFNCWTIESKPNASTADVTRLIILAQLIPLKKIEGANTSFIMDSFTRGEGIKVVIHEKGTYPEIEKHGVNIQPGRMNEINYETLFWKRLHTPVAPCTDENISIEDLGVYYTYKQSQCLNRMLQNELFTRCGCLNSEWPRSIKLLDHQKSLPYCQKLPTNVNDLHGAEQMKTRLDCFGSVLADLKQLKEKAVQQRVCIPRCGYYTYDTKLSVTSWDPDPYKLALYTKGYRHVDKFLNEPNQRKHIDELLENFDASIDVMKSKNQLTSISTLFSSDYQRFDDGTHTYISLIRQDFDTTLKEERLVFDIYILISRIGGLCSLCIGLTMAFIVELVEFLYLLCCKNDMKITQSNETYRLNQASKPMTVHCSRHCLHETEDMEHNRYCQQ
ncbi:FMRFamide-activated amiloride-sensitive sodium channel, partial [Schistosoma japonicum]